MFFRHSYTIYAPWTRGRSNQTKLKGLLDKECLINMRWVLFPM
jgi:hypothetical protein